MTSQLEQLLTCCICLDRFRNPKLLPCQHSVCMEPCMEGLVDYVRRQVKCPECRAEHRIPYNGVQGFPTNVTLQRFLEAHIEITGELPDPHTGQVMERCAVCNEKNYLSSCAHCEKKICQDCKAAHSEILKREIGRINNQVKRAVHRLSDQLAIVDRNISALKHNSDNVTEEIDSVTQRLEKAIRDRGDFLRNEVLSYYNTEQRNLTLLKEGLEQEISNVEANVDLAEKHMDDETPWDDCELMDTKDIFLRTMEFIRSFDYEAGDYNRRAKFNVPDDLNKMVSTLATLGELVIGNPKQSMDNFGCSSIPSGLMKSKSDHRLAVQFRDQEEGYSYSTGRTSPLPSRRRFGERPHVHEEAYDSQSGAGRRFRSRFMRREEEEEKTVRFEEENSKPPRPKVIDTEDVSRGPLSGILRMYDSSRVIQRIHEKAINATKKKEEPPPVAKPQPTAKPSFLQRKPSRQTSNEDEIDKIKKQNKNDTSSTVTAAAATAITPVKPTLERLTSLKDVERSTNSDRGSPTSRSGTHSPANPEDETSISRGQRETKFDFSSASTNGRRTSIENIPSSSQKTYTSYSRSSSTSSVGEGSSKVNSPRSPKSSETVSLERRVSRSNSTDSNKSAEEATPVLKTTGAAFSTDELRNRFQRSNDSSKSCTSTVSHSRGSSGGSSRYQSRFLPRPGTPSVETSKESVNDDDEDEESTDVSETEESEETSEEEEKEEAAYSRPDEGAFLGRSTRDTLRKERANDSGYGSSGGSRYGVTNSTESSAVPSHRRPSYLETSRSTVKEKEDDFESKYPYASKFLNRQKGTATVEEETKSPFQSRFLNKSKSSAILGPEMPAKDEDDSNLSPTSTNSSRAKFEELKERRQRLARSKSSAGMDDDTPATTCETTSPTTRSRYGRETEPTTTTPSSSRYSALGSSMEESSSTNQLSNWARYLKNKYGNKATTGTTSTPTSSIGASASSSVSSSASSNLLGSKSTPSSRAIARSRSSHLLGFGKENDSSEDDSKNACATPTSQAVGTLGPTPFGSIHRSQYLRKEKLLFKIGSRGSEPGCFTWPRGIAIGPDDGIIVADSSNHRIQVFDKEGNFLNTFGCYGNSEGEFDCLSGVAISNTGQYIIADRYNHRIQIFEPNGTFLRAFGSQGIGDGKFSYPWGVSTDSLGFIYVCDKENHRIQVFQSDGTFVGKFGSIGNKVGQLEHPHYITVTSTNSVIVSDSNNHRIQIFDINGKVVSTFGSEGSEEGHFKFPRGVAADEQGFIFVADSGNNRIQIFHPDGTFIRSFGCWGSGEGEFKGLEGVGVMSNGNILICDRENHRIQVF